jgi:Dolichyl-phosphate-mannose-protein mannosyltransferase
MMAATGLLALTLTVLVGAVAWTRQGNLTWDDADYLRQALKIVDRASVHGPLGTLPAVIGGTLRERPKPPLLVAWIAAGRLILGRPGDLRPLIVFATAVPFGLLAAASAGVAGRLAGPRAALAAVAALGASPLALTYGAKVMVETFMALWVLLVLYAAVRFLERPSRTCAAALGLALGLALMTKLTVALLLPAPFLALVVLHTRRHGLGRRAASLVLAALVPVAVVAGPWYVRNGRAAVRFAVFSARYSQVAEARTDEIPATARLSDLGAQVPGWPMLGVAALGGLAAWRARAGGGTIHEEPGRGARDFNWLALLGAAGGAAVLLRTSYFDPRFLLPIWAALAVVVGITLGRTSVATGLGPRAMTTLAAVLVVLGLHGAITGLIREPTRPTFWAARGLIDEMVDRYSVTTIGNLGNCAEWNVCKTGLINELRSNPGGCFVLFDVSQWTAQDVERRLDRLDAVVVLDDGTLTSAVRAAAPGLNRAFEEVRSRLRAGGRFDQVAVDARSDLPPLSVYVRRR